MKIQFSQDHRPNNTLSKINFGRAPNYVACTEEQDYEYCKYNIIALSYWHEIVHHKNYETKYTKYTNVSLGKR